MEGDERFSGVTIRQAVKMTVWARNTQLTISGYSPLEVATGRRPPDLFDVETADPEQLSATPPDEDLSTLALQRLAVRAHQEARQSGDLRHDMARRTIHLTDLTNKEMRCFIGTKIPASSRIKENGSEERY